MGDCDFSLPISSLIRQEDGAQLDANGDDDDDHDVTQEVVSELLDESKFLGSEEEYIEILVSRESSSAEFMTRNCNLLGSSELVDGWSKWARSDSIQWMMKTRARFGFSYYTAYLAVTYYDRFSMHRTFDKAKSWAVRLLSIACLSLAAKMEECIVPPLSGYQSEDCSFDSKSIQRMELLILSTLEWRMSSATPFSFLNYFKSKLRIDDDTKQFLSKSIAFISAIVHDINLVEHRASTIAAAAALAASNQRLNNDLVECKLGVLSSSCSGLKPEKVYQLYSLMIEGSKNCSSGSARSNKRRRLHLDFSSTNEQEPP